MITRNEAHLIQSLKDKRERDKEKLFVAEGPKIVGELLSSDWHIEKVYGLTGWYNINKALLARKHIDFSPISVSELERISLMTTPNQVLALVSIPEETEDQLIPHKSCISLVLDQIQDPGNLGTIIRTADWFNIRQIYCSPDCADPYNPKVVQSTMGSLLRVHIHHLDLVDFLRKIKDIPVYGTFLAGGSIYETSLTTGALVVIGNESKGVREELLPFINHRISIPHKTVSAESLNAAVAAGIVLSEFQRQLNYSPFTTKA